MDLFGQDQEYGAISRLLQALPNSVDRPFVEHPDLADPFGFRIQLALAPVVGRPTDSESLAQRSDGQQPTFIVLAHVVSHLRSPVLPDELRNALPVVPASDCDQTATATLAGVLAPVLIQPSVGL